jgi:hypothetical protein
MRRAKSLNENGSSSLEFITAGLLLLVPMVYLVLVISAVQGAALAAEGAARQAARVFVQAPSEAEGFVRAQRAIDFGLDDFGINSDTAVVTVTCTPTPTTCLQRQGNVIVTVTVLVDMPLVPAALGLNTLARVPIGATATQQVSRFWNGR